MNFSFDGFNITDVIVVIFTAASVYGAIRQDLKGIHEKIALIEQNTKEKIASVYDIANKAHDRIDTILNNHIDQ